MTDLETLYQGFILDHNRNPRNYAALPSATHAAERDNPFCGDRFTLYLEIDGERVRRAAFEGAGCAISKASASMLTALCEGKTLTQIERLKTHFYALIRSGVADGAEELGELVAFAAVSKFPARVACARLAWEALERALAAPR